MNADTRKRGLFSDDTCVWVEGKSRNRFKAAANVSIVRDPVKTLALRHVLFGVVGKNIPA